MSAAHRSLARLPLDVFTELSIDHRNANNLRAECCVKLKQASLGQTSGAGVTTVGTFLQLSSPALLRILDPLLTLEECEEMKRRVCLCCAPQSCSALSLLRATTYNGPVESMNPTVRYISTGMSSLDTCLRGGFRVGTISEIVGRAGTGKSQLAMQLCVVAARFNQGTVYIDTEKKLNIKRLQEIAKARVDTKVANEQHDMDLDCVEDSTYDAKGVKTREAFDANATYQFKTSQQVLENITVHSPDSTNELISALNVIEEEILRRNEEAQESESTFPVRLIVLDSIAAPARRDFGSESAPQRVSAVMQVAQTLKRIADQLECAVVVINQVGLENWDAASHQADGCDFVAVRAALGTSWHHCLSTRLLMEHERDPHRLNSATDEAQTRDTLGMEGEHVWQFTRGHIRRATVVKSNVTGLGGMNYEIVNIGVVEM